MKAAIWEVGVHRFKNVLLSFFQACCSLVSCMWLPDVEALIIPSKSQLVRKEPSEVPALTLVVRFSRPLMAALSL